MKRSDKNENQETTESSRFSSFIYYFDIVYRVVKTLVILLIVLLVIGGSLGAGTAVGYFASLVHGTEQPDQEEMVETINDYDEKSTMYYAGGEVISDLRSDLIRTPIELEDVSPQLIDAIVATEDEYFFEHEGVVPKAVARALVQDITETGSTGGSTLTQQLIKQQIVGAEVSHERKAVEILYAMHLENYAEKDDILEAYLNISPFGRNNKGQNIAGVEEAAQGIFGVSSSDLNLPQAAFIAGLPQNPIVYSPYTQYGEIKDNHEQSLTRQLDVLFRMYREAYITFDEYTEAREYDVTEDFIDREEADDEDTSYLYYLAEQEARNLLIEDYMESDDITNEDLQDNPDLYNEYYERADYDIRNRGYHIHTSIDRSIHNALEQSVRENQDELGIEQSLTWTNDDGESQTETFPVQMSGSLIDNATGRVIAFVGGRDFEYSEFNYAFDSGRSPASVIKPLAVYGPALEEGLITPASIIPDTEYEVPDVFVDGEMTYHTITNYGETTDEWMTAREALYRSQNIPTTKLYDELKEVADPEPYMRRMGIDEEAIGSEEFDYGSFPIGGTDEGPSPVELISAFSSIGNNGVHAEPYVIERIEDSNGDLVYEHEVIETEVWSPETNYLLADILRQTHTDGTAQGTMNQLAFDADWASKTGTSNSYNDMWYVASTPRVSFGTWIGYGDSRLSLRHDYGVHPSQRNRNIWARLMNVIYEQNPDILGIGESFSQPGGITTDSVIQDTGMKAGTVETPDGNTFSYSGGTQSELFDENNIPGSTVYDFAIGATDEELEEFWSSYQGSDEQVSDEDTDEVSSSDANDSGASDSNNDSEASSSGSNDSGDADSSNDDSGDSNSNEDNNSNGNGNGNGNRDSNNNGSDNDEESNGDDEESSNGNGNGNGDSNNNSDTDEEENGDEESSNGNGNGNDDEDDDNNNEDENNDEDESDE